ncbi:MAG TPA: EamA family transporter, partial [Anaerolineae bacterium]|nr:EamA family transporter [Anaerolineae bacterium]
MNRTWPQAALLSGQWFVLAAAVLWGTTGTAQAFAPVGAHPLSVGAMRLLVGGIALFMLARSRGKWQRRGWPWGKVLLAAAGLAGYQLFFFAAVARAGVAVGTVTAIGSVPVTVGLLTWLVYGIRPSLVWLISTTLAVIGVGLLALAGQEITLDLLGLGLAIAAGTSYALYVMSSKELVKTHSPSAITALISAVGLVLILPLFFVLDFSWLAQPRGTAVALYLGLVTLAAAYLLFTRGLVHISADMAATLTLAEPLTAAVLGLVLLREPAMLSVLAGMGLIFAG